MKNYKESEVILKWNNSIDLELVINVEHNRVNE
jgi:hypothetical protein